MVGVLILGIFSQGMVMIRSGLVYDFGMGFWGPNGHDGIWHLALANQTLRGFPPPQPTFAGYFLTNYHYFYDLFLALINKITLIPIPFLYFQIFPLLLAFSLGYLSFLVGWRWRKDFWIGFWLAFFNFFAGSFGYLVTLWRQGQLGGESFFWSMQSISTQLNPPFALSLVLILVGLYLLLRIKKWHFWQILMVAFVWGILIDVKAYAGIVGLAGLGVFSILRWFKKQPIYLVIFLLSTVIAASLFLLINPNAGSIFVFQPFWFIHSMIESPDRLYLPKIALARYFLISYGFGFRLLMIEVLSLLIFLLGNLGTRIVGLYDLARRFKKLDEVDGFLITGGITGLVIPLFFIQKGTAWNTIQFFYYFLFFANFYAAAALSYWFRSKKTFNFLIACIVVILTVPTTLSTLRDYFGWPPPAAIPKAELEGLSFLRNQKPGIVLTYPYFEQEKKNLPTPVSLRIYQTTAYVSALSSKQTFLEDEMNLDIMGVKWRPRRDLEEQFFTTRNEEWARNFLKENNIKYVYLVDDQKFEVGDFQVGLVKIFENGEVRIFEFRDKI